MCTQPEEKCFQQKHPSDAGAVLMVGATHPSTHPPTRACPWLPRDPLVGILNGRSCYKHGVNCKCMTVDIAGVVWQLQFEPAASSCHLLSELELAADNIVGWYCWSKPGPGWKLTSTVAKLLLSRQHVTLTVTIMQQPEQCTREPEADGG